MAAVLGRDRRDEPRLPPRDEVVDPVERAQAGEQRVDDPEVAAAPRHLVGIDRPGVDRLARQVAGVVGAGRVEPGGQRRDAAELPDLVLHRDRQALPVGTDRHAHRAGQAAVGQDQLATVRGRGGQHQLARLVGRDQQRDPMLRQERRQRPAVLVIDPTRRRRRLAFRFFRHGERSHRARTAVASPVPGRHARREPAFPQSTTLLGDSSLLRPERSPRAIMAAPTWSEKATARREERGIPAKLIGLESRNDEAGAVARASTRPGRASRCEVA